MLDDGEVDLVRSLLDNDQELLDAMSTTVKETAQSMQSIVAGIDIIETIHSCLEYKQRNSWSDMYIKAMSGELGDSIFFREMLLAVKKMPSGAMYDMLKRLSEHLPALRNPTKDLAKLIATTGNVPEPLRSEHDVQHNTLRTTVVAHKVELSKQTAALSKHDLAYTKIVNDVNKALRGSLQEIFINPQDFFLHELFLYDAKSTYRDVFVPRPRFAVERALSSPHDYLGCNCCDSSENGLSSTQPATAILYQLYLESGSQINVADLWSAFSSIVGAEEPDDEEADQQRCL